MIIEIKGKQYVNPDWRIDKGIGELQIHTEATFTELAADFVLEQGASIKQYNDNEEQIGEWYVEGMASIQLPGEDGSKVAIIKYHISQLGLDAQEAINADLDDATMSVLELAGMLSTAKRNFNDTATRVEASQAEQSGRIDTLTQITNQLNEAINRCESMYNILADRVAVLENK